MQSFGPPQGDMAAMLQQALQGQGQGQPLGAQPQNTQQIDPMQPEVMGPDMIGVDPVTEIQQQLDAVMAQMDITQDPMELQQLAGVARELQMALEAALQQEPMNAGGEPESWQSPAGLYPGENY